MREAAEFPSTAEILGLLRKEKPLVRTTLMQLKGLPSETWRCHVSTRNLLQQGHTEAHQERRNPTAMVHVFFEENLGHHGADDECKRSGGRGYQAEIAPGERRQQAEEADGEATQRKQ